MEIRTLHLDLETYSSADIAKTGVFRYVEAEDFEILLMSYAFDDEPVQVWDFTRDGAPDWLAGALTDPGIVKAAHNCQFERACLHRALGTYSPPEQWQDTMHLAAMNGLPMTLEGAGEALRLEQQKLDTGKALIRYFCRPCAPTKANGGRTRNLPEHAPEKWAQFKAYCLRDTETEREILHRLRGTRVTETERRVECLDARINERGVGIDRKLVSEAIAMDDAFKAARAAEMRGLTGLENPNSLAQLKAWLGTRGLRPDSLDKKALAGLLAQAADPTTRRVLTLRQLLGKSSTAKYAAMREAACADGRIRGVLQYYGAGRTGRWAGRLVQVQNLPQNHLEQIEQVREIARRGDLTGLELVYGSVPDVLSQLIRTAIVARDGYTFLVADYHAIEAVCIAYLADERWRLDVFAGDGKIYEASYAQAFGVPKESVKKGSPERQKGKIMELALGYGGGANALVAFGADKLGLDSAQMAELVSRWRAASPAITRMWRTCERAAKTALSRPGEVVRMNNGCAYLRDRDALRLILPSGRRLSYWSARVVPGSACCRRTAHESLGHRLEPQDSSPAERTRAVPSSAGYGEVIQFEGQNQTTRRWERMETWGGRLVENIVQAFARDILAEALLRLEDAGYRVVFSVHDEVIVEAPRGARVEEVQRIMAQPVDWAPGLDRYLHADGYETPFYKKD